MTKKRPPIPSAIKNQVLKEYHHLCAICGGKSPQLHHIDGNPANNDPLNLIPFCPNHHMRDQHDPTSPLEQGIVRLFRRYKDPALLTPQFYPIFKRLRFLSVNTCDDYNPVEIETCWKDLLNFISTLTMGKYYSERLATLIRIPLWAPPTRSRLNSDPFQSNWRPVVETFPRVIPVIEGVLVEMLRYQGWKYEPEES